MSIAKACNTYIPQKAVCGSCSGTLCHIRSRRPAYGLQAKLAPTDFDLQPNSQGSAKASAQVHGLLFNGLNPRNPCNYMNYYSLTVPGRMEGWVGLVRWLIADTLPTKWSHVNYRSGKVHQSCA